MLYYEDIIFADILCQIAEQKEAERQALESKAKFTVKHSIAHCLVIYFSPCHRRYKNSFFYVLTMIVNVLL